MTRGYCITWTHYNYNVEQTSNGACAQVPVFGDQRDYALVIANSINPKKALLSLETIYLCSTGGKITLVPRNHTQIHMKEYSDLSAENIDWDLNVLQVIDNVNLDCFWQQFLEISPWVEASACLQKEKEQWGSLCYQTGARTRNARRWSWRWPGIPGGHGTNSGTWPTRTGVQCCISSWAKQSADDWSGSWANRLRWL